MADLHRRLEKAEKYLQKGKQQDALSEYLAILNDEPGNDSVRQQAADLCLTMGKSKEALKLLSALFDRQATSGDPAKAIANYKKLSRLGTPTVDQIFKYSQLIEKSDKKLALEGYQQAVNVFVQTDRNKEALSAYQRLVALDGSTANYKALAKLAASQGDKKSAGAAYLKLAELDALNADMYLETGYGIDRDNQELALAFARSLTAKGKTDKALNILEPLSTSSNPPEYREAYARALMAAGQPADAEPIVWQLFEKRPQQAAEVGELIGAFLKQEKSDKARAIADRLEDKMKRQNKRRDFVDLMKAVVQKQPPTAQFLEYLVALYNSASREQDYCEALLALFNLYFAGGLHLKAADCLERVAEVDPYQDGNQRRLEMLKGKIDDGRYNAIYRRVHGTSAGGGLEAQE
jgi:tetratricopeptide (TPR) repeat protein